jgi:hypothetical protein
MTRTTNARIAGSTYLLYIAAGIGESVLFGSASNAEGTPAKLARIAQHASDVQIAVVLSLLTCFAALVLAVTLYAITRVEDEDLAVLALSCRVGEGILNALGPLTMLGLLWIAKAEGGPSDAAAPALGALLLKVRGFSPTISATFFSVGSTLFSWLLLRGRMIPVSLAWLGVLASALLAVCLPLQLVGILGGAVGWLLWLPMLVFELALAGWLLVKGVAAPATRAGDP